MNVKELSLQTKDLYPHLDVNNMSKVALEWKLIDNIRFLSMSDAKDIAKKTAGLATLVLHICDAKDIEPCFNEDELDDDYVDGYKEDFCDMCIAIVLPVVNSYYMHDLLSEVLFNCNQIAKAYDFDLETEINNMISNMKQRTL